MVSDDPWFWSVNDLVAEVCHSMSLFRDAGCENGNLPDAAALEDQLREQDITGKAFLTTLDSNTLRYKLQTQHIGQRKALKSVVDILRRHSTGYQQHTATVGVQALNFSNEQFRAPPAADVNNRKRRKIAHLTTTPLPAVQTRPEPDYAALARELESQPAVDGTGDWDHLTRWQKDDGEDDDEQALEEDDLEDEASYSAHDVAEEDAQDAPNEVEEPQEAQSKRKMPRDQVIAIINQRIQHFTDTWKPNKGASKGGEIHYKPVSMWEEAEATGERQKLVEKYTTDAAYYRRRLDLLCDEIVKFSGNNADTVRRQCNNLEVTIDSLELAEWLLSIYNLDPVDNSEEEEELHDRSPGEEHTLADRRSQLQSGIHQPKVPVEIIDLGSPESSQGEHVEVPFKNPIAQRTSFVENWITSNLYHTSSSAVADSVEPSMSGPPDLNVALYAAPKSERVQLDNEPEKTSIASVRRWKWIDLVDAQDRKRVVSKALQEMKWDDRETIRNRLKTVGKADMMREIPACIAMLARRETKMQGVLPQDMPKIITFTTLFLCWWLCDNYFRVEPSRWHLEELEQCLVEGSPDPSTFCKYLAKIMTTTFNPDALTYPERPSQTEVIDISSDDEEPAPKQRKPATQPSQVTRRGSVITLD